MNTYLKNLISTYQTQKNINWNEVLPISEQKTISYNSLKKKNNDNILSKVAILKLNGGLGTSMGCVGPKSIIPIKNNLTFLDIICNQVNSLNVKYNANIPLILMNSLNTEIDTKHICKKYNIDILYFNQKFLPRMNLNFEPLSNKFKEDEKDLWYPPGHGDIYNSLLNSEILNDLIKRGIKYLFISNSDNLGAVFDEKILQFIDLNNKDFVMEVVEKTLADKKGGILIEYKNRINLLEVAQVPEEHLDEFYDIEKFRYFNTNNIWLNIEKLTSNIEMDVIYNAKKLKDGTSVVQLEIAMGSAIKSFKNSAVINVPRNRFRPVKTCEDLFLIHSDLFDLDKNFHINCSFEKMQKDKFFDDIPINKLIKSYNITNIKDKINVFMFLTYQQKQNKIGNYNLIISLYNETKISRALELLYCLRQNLSNPYINTIHILLEKKNDINTPYFIEDCINILIKYNKNKNININITYILKRPQFNDIFNYCNKNINGTTMIANSDIIYDKTLSKINISDDDFIALTRYNLYNNKYEIMKLKTGRINIYSQDTWIFKSPMKYDINYPVNLGAMFCDSALIYILKNNTKYNVSNKSLYINSFHIQEDASVSETITPEQKIEQWKLMRDRMKCSNFVLGITLETKSSKSEIVPWPQHTHTHT